MSVDAETAARFMALTLGHLDRRWPFKLDHVMTGPEDVVAPEVLHPIFHGSFDWHSCVHGHWQVLRLARLFPDLPVAAAVRAHADAAFTAEKAAGELAHFQRPAAAGASRPYGRAWLLALHGEVARHAAPWAAALEPLARHLAATIDRYLAVMTYPIRVGTHFNSAFAMLLTHHWAERRDPALAGRISARARDWFGQDVAAQAWEPGGDEFLSPTLIEALLMGRVLPADAFAGWFDAFLPDVAAGRPATLFTPAHVSDRTDGKIAHLDGLNLSRAWCWQGVADALPPGHAAIGPARAAAAAHLAAGLPHVAGDYMGEHWLATYALLASGEAPD